MGNLKLNIEQNYTLWDNVDTWIEGGEEWSKHFKTTDNLWDTIILPKIKPYIKGNVLEIAPGHGRITRKLLESNVNLDIIDLSNTCIKRCWERFGNTINNYYVGNGSDLKNINSNSKDFVGYTILISFTVIKIIFKILLVEAIWMLINLKN